MTARSRAHLVLGILLSGCGAVTPLRVDSWTAPGADFARFRTYAWTNPQVPTLTRTARDPVAALDRRLRAAVDAELAQRGFVRAGGAAVDFWVDYDVDVREQHTESFRDVVRYRAAGGMKDAGESFVQGFHEGTILLEVVDGHTRETVWRASASTILDEDDPQRRVEAAAHAMVARFGSR